MWRNFRSPIVDVTNPRRGPAVKAVYATGTVEPSVMMPIAARLGARLTSLQADEGSDVKEGQTLAELESDDLQQQLSELKAREELAQRNYARSESLLKTGVITREEFDRAHSNWDAAKAAVNAAKAQLGFTKLLAPASGRIIRRDGEIGQLIPANQPVFWMSCCAPLRVTSEVDEEDISLIKPAQTVLIRADAFPGQIFRGQVQSITPKGDPIARSYRVRIGLDETTPLLIGMTAETNIIIEERSTALLVPTSAVQGDVIWLVRNSRLLKQLVTVGVRGPKSSEILQGLSEDDALLINPTAELESDTAVRTHTVNWDP